MTPRPPHGTGDRITWREIWLRIFGCKHEWLRYGEDRHGEDVFECLKCGKRK